MAEYTKAPEVGRWSADRIGAEQRKFKRVVLAFQDLGDMRAFTSRLLDFKALTPSNSSDDFVIEALITSIVVGYGRCFTQTRVSGHSPSSLPASFGKGLSPELRQLHQRILYLRNTEFAHSDVETAEVSVNALPHFRRGALLPEARRLRKHSISDVELAAIPQLLSALHIYLYDELVRLNEALARYGDF
jgi:hypothetical protein